MHREVNFPKRTPPEHLTNSVEIELRRRGHMQCPERATDFQHNFRDFLRPRRKNRFFLVKKRLNFLDLLSKKRLFIDVGGNLSECLLINLCHQLLLLYSSRLRGLPTSFTIHHFFIQYLLKLLVLTHEILVLGLHLLLLLLDLDKLVRGLLFTLILQDRRRCYRPVVRLIDT